MAYQSSLTNSQNSLDNPSWLADDLQVAETKATGIGLPNEAANQPQCHNAAFFASGVPINGGPGGAAARLAGASSVVQLRSVCHPYWTRDGGNQTATEANTMAKATTKRTRARFTFSAYTFARRFFGPVASFRIASMGGK